MAKKICLNILIFVFFFSCFNYDINRTYLDKCKYYKGKFCLCYQYLFVYNSNIQFIKSLFFFLFSILLTAFKLYLFKFLFLFCRFSIKIYYYSNNMVIHIVEYIITDYLRIKDLLSLDFFLILFILY